MITGWPRACASFSPIVRARMSVVPPGANGTIHLIGFAGHACAFAVDASAASMSATSALTIRFIDSPLV